MTATVPQIASRPLSEINTTPLIDVLLVLLVMLVITIPVATHSLEVEVPQGPTELQPRAVSNDLTLTADGALAWNGRSISDGQLVTLLERAKAMPVIPELRFEPDARTSYARIAAVLKLIKGSGIKGFGFVGNERFAEFGKAE